MSVSEQPIPRVALVGVSGYAALYRRMVRDAHDQRRLTTVAAVIINPGEEAAAVEEFAQRGTRVYHSFEQMIVRERGTIDLCLVPTGIPWHARMVVQALRADMNVLVEKPLAGSVADAAAIREAETAAAGRFVAVGFQDIYGEAALWFREQIRTGAIGRPRAVRVIGRAPRAKRYYTRNNWAGRLHADGAAVFDSPFNNAFAHQLNLALFFAGEPNGEATALRVTDAELFRAHAIESFDTGVVRAVSPGGTRFWFGTTHACNHAPAPEITLEGDAGRAVWRHERECVIAPCDAAPLTRALPDNAASRLRMLDRVLRRVHDATIPMCDTAIAAGHVALIAAIHQAAPIGEFVPGQVEWRFLGEGASPVPIVRGLEAALERAFSRQCTLRKAGFTV